MKVLVAVDGSESSKAAVASVAARPWPAGTEIKILAVAELHIMPTPEFGMLPASYYEQAAEAAHELAAAAIKSAADIIQQRTTAGLTVSTDTKTGFAKSVILDEAERWGADLVVVGSHGYKGVQRFLLGSVSAAIAAHAPCSVEIVRVKK
ncbi:MAG: universal stress protein [Acidobacteria bacterium]|nr:universal stress protein [Acidobacteriota bacterium]